jgi:transposase
LEDESYSILNQRAIIDLLIQGDIFPYMTGSEIQYIGMKFGVSYEEGSCWKILQSILFSLHTKGKTIDFFTTICLK